MSKILIAGGYGEVGSMIAGELSKGKNTVVIAGRDIGKAERLARDLGGKVAPAKTDVNNPDDIRSVLEGVSLVINCVDQAAPYHLVKEAVAKGIDYIDITPHEAFIRAALDLAPLAKKSGSCAVLSAGLVPGIANVMARAGAGRAGGADEIRTNVLLSVGDKFGAAAMDYMLDVLSHPFSITERGKKRRVENLRESSIATFPLPFLKRRVYRYNLPDQFFYPDTLKAETAGTYIAIEPAALMKLLVLTMRAGTGTLMRFNTFRSLFKKVFISLQGFSRGSEAWALSVEAKGPRGACVTALSGESESRATAAGATVMARRLLSGKRPAGVWLPEQLFEPDPFFEGLAEFRLKVEINDGTGRDPDGGQAGTHKRVKG